MPVLPVTVFADFTCPACYVTETALRRLAGTGDLAVRYRAAELDPAGDADAAEHVARRAAEMGLALGSRPFAPPTGKAHEAAKAARELGAEDPMRDAIYRAYSEDGLDIGRIDVLQALAPAAGLDALDLRLALDVDRFRHDVLHDQEVARRLRIRHGPVLYLGVGPGARILTGAQSEAEISEAILSFEL